MAIETHVIDSFYATPRGIVAARLLRARLRALWPDLTRQHVLGLGYAAPYLRPWRETTARCVAVWPAHMGPGSRTADPFGFTCLAAEDALPFADFSFDRVLLVHGLETAENARRLLREVWRVMADDGRLIVVAPNRRGMWAHADSTPFGHGQPYSPGQIGQLLRAAMFSVERRDAALFVPPTRLRIVLNSAPVWERTGRRFARGLAGLTITEAVKDMYAAVPAGAVLDGAAPARRAVIAEAA